MKRLLTKLHLFLINKFSEVNRVSIANKYLNGVGLEIGAMEAPLIFKTAEKVLYLDRCTEEESEKIFPSLKGKLVKVDIIDDGEQLTSIESDKFDFVIANHFIEHTQNPVFTIENMLRVIKKGGRIFMAIPDKRFTFDCLRENTTILHFCKDYEQGPEWSESDHYYDFVKHTEHGMGKSDAEINIKIEELKERNFSIHFHVWDHMSMIEMFLLLKTKYMFPLEIEVALAAKDGGNESLFILKKL